MSLSATQQAVFRYLAANNPCSVDRDTLAERSNCSINSVKRAIVHLTREGLVIAKRKSGRGYLYTFTVPDNVNVAIRLQVMYQKESA